MSELFNNVKVGDTVHYSTPQGQSGRGKVVIHKGTHLVLNAGGKHGRPQVVTDKNYIKHSRDGKIVGALLSRLSHVREMRNPSGPYGGHPYDWDPELRKQIFAAAAKKVKKLPGSPQPSKLETGRAYKPSYNPPPRRGTANEAAKMRVPNVTELPSNEPTKKKTPEQQGLIPSGLSNRRGLPDAPNHLHKHAAAESKKWHAVQHINYYNGQHHVEDWYDSDATVASYSNGKLKESVELFSEGNIPKVHGFENFKNMAHDWANYNDHHNGGRPLLHQKTVETDKVLHQTISIGHHPRSGNPYVIGVFNHTGGPNSEEGHGTHHHYTQGLELDEDSKDAEGAAERVAKTKKHKKKLHEVSAPGKEAWIKANKARFIERYGKEKGLRVLYAKAWKDSKVQNESIEEASVAIPYKDVKADIKKLLKNKKKEKKDPNLGKGNRIIPYSKIRKDLGEARENEYTANLQLAASTKKPAKGHYLMRDGRRLSGPHSPEEAVKQYKGMSDSKGVKIVHVKEGVEFDVTTTLMEAATKYKKAAEKAISLAKKAKGNKHVNTQPELNIQDKGGSGPIESNHQEEGDGKL